VSDIREDFKRSSRFGIIGVLVVGAAAAAIALLFGSGADPTGAMAAILALVFGFVALLFYLQRRDLNAAQRRTELEAIGSREPVADPTTVDDMSLLADLATGPVDREAIARATGRTWGMVRDSQRSGWILMVLIACAVIPWQLWQEVWSIAVFVPVIIVYLLYLVVRLLMPGGTLERAYDDSAASLEPLGLELSEHPQVKLRRDALGPVPVRHRVEGDVVMSGRRHGRPVTVRLGGSCATSVSGAVEPFEVKVRGERLRAASGAPAAVESVLAALRASSWWKGVSVTGGADGVTVERKGTGEHWMCDLWLAERLADAATAG
jgi:hypothetical protein